MRAEGLTFILHPHRIERNWLWLLVVEAAGAPKTPSLTPATVSRRGVPGHRPIYPVRTVYTVYDGVRKTAKFQEIFLVPSDLLEILYTRPIPVLFAESAALWRC